MTARLTPTEIDDIRKRAEAFQRGEIADHASAEWWAVEDRGNLLAHIDATMEVGTVDEIAAIVCKHVPPVRFCDRGATCPCWAEYALPAAREILARFQLLPAPPSPKEMT